VRKGVSQTAIRAASAREAVGKHINVQWTDVQASALSGTFATRAEALQSCLNDVSVIKNGSPSLVFVFTDRTKHSSKPGDKAGSDSAPKSTPQVKASADAWAELFQQDGDYVTLILGRFFNVVKMDATQVEESQNKYISTEKAPMVILTRKSGLIDSVYDGRAKIKSGIIAKAMSDVLKKDGTVTGSGSVAGLNALMVQLEKVELALIYANENEGKIKSKNSHKERTSSRAKAGKESGSSQPETAAQKSIDGAEALVAAKTKEKNDILGKEYAMLKVLGLPDSKLPNEIPSDSSSQSDSTLKARK